MPVSFTWVLANVMRATGWPDERFEASPAAIHSARQLVHLWAFWDINGQ